MQDMPTLNNYFKDSNLHFKISIKRQEVDRQTDKQTGSSIDVQIGRKKSLKRKYLLKTFSENFADDRKQSREK
jgi:hypothetical protein